MLKQIKSKWLLDLTVEGKRLRIIFDNEKDAKKALAIWEKKKRQTKFDKLKGKLNG